MPNIRIPQSVAKRAVLKAYLSDGVTEATGKTLACTLSKNGAAFGNPSAGATNATEIASGWYFVDLSTTDTGTLGPLIIRGTATGVDPSEAVFEVAADAANLAALAAYVDTEVAAILAAVDTEIASIIITLGAAGAGLTALGDARLANLDAAVSSRLASGGYTAPDNATIAAIAGFVDTEVAAIKAKTDNLPASPAATGAEMTLTAAYSAATTAAQPGDIPTAIQNADALLARDLSAVVGAAARSPLNALRKLMNKVALLAGVLSIFEEDDTTVAYTQTVASDGAQEPISSLDTN